ncbi:protein-export chaperone SecB, partial [Francisella tularensis subsp. holarctica]|uniref:protein-export chaperone SecB n=1 Tax=Francisella tularensis TaxID=263 RepID=UPI002381C512
MQQYFLIQKVYTKYVSFETINSHACFKEQWNPSSDFNIDINTTKIHDENFELDLTITVTTKNNENNSYIAEVTQSGIFT